MVVLLFACLLLLRCVFPFLFLMGSLTLSLSGFGFFCFSVFKPLNGNWKVGGRMGGNKKNENMGVFLSLRIGTGFSYNGFIGILINLWHNYILLYSELFHTRYSVSWVAIPK